MCGIFGIVCDGLAALGAKERRALLDGFFRCSEIRGKDAAGLAVVNGARVDIFKAAGSASAMIRSTAYGRFVGECVTGQAPFAAIGHARLVTNGWQTENDNNQPVATEHFVGIHNGIITNVDALVAAHPGMPRSGKVDTEVIFRLLDRARAEGRPIETALAETMAALEGVANLAFFDDGGQALHLVSNNGSLYWKAAPGVFAFASERVVLERALKHSPLHGALAHTVVRQVRPGTAVQVRLADAEPEAFALDRATAGPPPTPRRLDFLIHSNRRPALRRCTRCVLPATFPGIRFDAQGVCSVCHGHKDKPPAGRAALERLLAPIRSRDGSPDCVVAFSGGRDSSYGLHYITRELGMHPVAFTYDWGMVTDLARRNQSRMCARLGIEHVIRSPDIARKRRYIRYNINAWLKKPDLGMVPLFMAGDKQFYHYARQVRDEFGVKAVLFCAGNELERTEFKSGFCGVRESAHGQRLYDYSVANKIGLALYYLGQYLRNPAYINASLLDTLWAYHATYLAKDDFLYLYHYIPWDERTIEDTLRRDYDWENAADTANTWRIGDGTAAFYNYIYHTVAGFSEHDTFRSNQIRAGLIDRDEALLRLADDNRPRWESMRQYAATIGFNLEEALGVINAIPKLYD